MNMANIDFLSLDFILLSLVLRKMRFITNGNEASFRCRRLVNAYKNVNQ